LSGSTTDVRFADGTPIVESVPRYNYRVRSLGLVLVALIGCGGDSTKSDPPIGSSGSSNGSTTSGGSSAVPSTMTGSAGSAATGSAAGTGSNATGNVGSAAGSAPSLATGGADLLPYVKQLYDVVACGLDGKLPDDMAKADKDGKLAAVVAQHCDQLRPYIAKFRTTYFDSARAWFVEHEPKDLPKTVVYPFGGGDLISLLVPFPDATDYTTVSLELAGDPRHLGELDAAKLRDSLRNWRVDIGPVINIGMNSSVNLSDEQRNVLAAQLSSHLLGLVTGGYEVVGARYFTLDDQGAVHYVEQAQLDADTKTGKSMSGNWKSPAFAQSFANVELQFRKIGDPTVRTYRHVAWNLDNAHLKSQPGLLRYLDAKGKVAIVVKGAVYLLWTSDFAAMRDYILGHLAWMASDSTGVPPNYATPAGMTQEAYGRYDGAMLDHSLGKREDLAMRKLWETPAGPIAFRYGYTDHAGHAHVLITHPK